MLGVMYL